MKLLLKVVTAFVLVHPLASSDLQMYNSVLSKSSLKVTGTSSLHDWEMSVDDFSCQVTFIMGNPSIKLLDINFNAEANSFKSHSNIMDNKTLKAIRADEHPIIQFKSNNIDFKIPLENESNGILPGELTIGGKTTHVNLPFKVEMISDESVEVTGTIQLKMTDFEIDPPTALLGTLQTGNEIEIHFKLIFEM